jgi:hypothetical protein
MLTQKAFKAMMEWNQVNESLVIARFLSKFIKISVIQIYAPTNEATDDEKSKQIEQIQSIIETIPKHDILLMMGDMQAKIGKDNTEHEDVIGKHGLGEMNNNGEHLINLCEIHNLEVTGSP